MYKEKIILGSDHGGFRLKEIIIDHIKDLVSVIEDVGCNSTESCDYPQYGREVALRVSEGNQRGILICGTGIGMSLVANRIKGVRAALCHNEYTALMSRKHNDSNILVLGERVIGVGLALNIVDVWLKTDFEYGRHKKRIDMIDQS